MFVLESFGGVRGQQLHRVVLAARKRNRAIRLHEVVKIIEKFGGALCLVDGLCVPHFHKFHERLNQVRPLQPEMAHDKIDRMVRTNSVQFYFAVQSVKLGEECGPVRQTFKHAAETDLVSPHRLHRGP